MSSVPGPTMELVRAEGDHETYFLNMGPQHPSTHGVLRLQLHLEGDTELGLYVKNFLDALELDSARIPLPVRQLMRHAVPMYERLFGK